jgi:sulfite reductase alpha subunit-like flavoprotein
MPDPPEEVGESIYKFSTTEESTYKKADPYLPPGTQLLEVLENTLMSAADYDRDVRHYGFDIKDKGMDYGVGECLAVYPHNVED